MKSDFLLAFNEIAEVRKLPREVIMEALQAALVSAYRRNSNVGSSQHVEARIDEQTGIPSIWVEKEVVEDIHSEQTEVLLEEALAFEPDAQMGDMVLVESTPENFGRIAAQTAKQVILQRMREAEREAQYQEYHQRVGDLITGTVQSDSGGVVTIGLGRIEAILPQSQQMPGERYRMHSKVRAYVMEVRKTNRGPQIIVSRTHRNMLRRLLEYEVPEIYNGTVEIKNIAREPGARSKVAVAALQEGADPVGACVGMRGVRIQSIVKELNNEKIDVIEWNPDQRLFISKALSPARVSGVFLDDDPDQGRTAIVVVPDDQLSLAIGREGQNARLAAKLTGWRIDIKSITEAAEEALAHIAEEPELAGLSQALAEPIAQVNHIMGKKEANRPVMPEDYETLVDFLEVVENYRLELKEVEHAERRSQLGAAREQVPSPAYEHPLEDTDLPLRVYNVLVEAGYTTVGEVMEQYYLEPQELLDLSGFGPVALEAVEQMIDTLEFPEPVVEEVEPEAEAVPEEEPEAEAVAIAEDAAVAEVAEGEAVPVEAVAAEEPVAEAVEAGEPLPPSPEVKAVPELDQAAAEARARRAALVARLAGQDGLVTEEEPVVVEQEAQPVPAEAEVEEPELEELFAEEEEEGEEDMQARHEAEEEARRERKKHLRRQLVYDEELGRVVAKRRRKRGGRQPWEAYEELGDLDDLDEIDDLE